MIPILLMVIECGVQSEDNDMNKQIKRLLLAELSSKRKLAKSINENLPVNAVRTRSKSNDIVRSFYMIYFDKDNIFHFDTWVKSDDVTFYCKETESYTINDLKQKLNLSESWFEPFVNEE